MSDKYDIKRYKEFLWSGVPKRVYMDIPEAAHTAAKELAKEHGLPMTALLGLLIADAIGKPKRVVKKKPTTKRTVKKKSVKKRGKKK